MLRGSPTLAILAGFAFLSCQRHTGASADLIRVVYISKIKNETFHDNIAKGVREEALDLGVVVDILYADNQQDVETQRSYLRTIAREHSYAGVMLAPNDSLGLIEDVATVDRENIYTLFVDTPLVNNERTRRFRNNCGFVGTDNVLAGRLAGEFVKTKLLQGGRILMIRGNQSHQTSIDREIGFLAALGPSNGFHIAGFLSGNWEEEAAEQSVFRFFKDHPENVEAIFAYSDPMAIGASHYYDQHPELVRPVIVGVDGVLLGQRSVLQKRTSATVVQSPEFMGRVGLRTIVSCIRSESHAPAQILTPVTLLQLTETLEAGELL